MKWYCFERDGLTDKTATARAVYCTVFCVSVVLGNN